MACAWWSTSRILIRGSPKEEASHRTICASLGWHVTAIRSFIRLRTSEKPRATSSVSNSSSRSRSVNRQSSIVNRQFPIRWGLIGTGDIAEKRVAAALQSLGPLGSLVAVASRRISNARAFAERHGIPEVYPSFKHLLAD